MTITESQSVGRRFAGRHVASPVARSLTLRTRKVPVLGPSIRLPVTPANRRRLRALRAAELTAWHQPPRPGANAALRAEVANSTTNSRRESCLMAGLVLAGATAIMLGFLASLHFVRQYADFVECVRQLLGLA